MHDDTIERQKMLEESIKELDYVNKELAKLGVIKEDLVKSIIDALGHEHDGQKSYDFGVWKVEVKTPSVYSLNKKLYESGSVALPAQFNPIKHSTAYSIDKRLCEMYMECAPIEVCDMLVELIERKPGKANVVIKDRI